jgi:hypothetical protein
MAAPQFEAMAQRYPDVIFAKVVEDHSRELIMSEGACLRACLHGMSRACAVVCTCGVETTKIGWLAGWLAVLLALEAGLVLSSSRERRCLLSRLRLTHPDTHTHTHTGIRAFPTFRIYHNSQVLDEIQGANIPAVEAAVQRHRASLPAASFSGSGVSLGGGGNGAVPWFSGGVYLLCVWVFVCM